MKICFISLAIFTCLYYHLEAQIDSIAPKKIYDIWIKQVSRPSTLHGALFEVKDSSVIISNTLKKKDYQLCNYALTAIRATSIDYIQIRRYGKDRKGALIGATIGLAINCTFAVLTGINNENKLYAYMGGFLISLPIAGVTTLVGALIGKVKMNVPVQESLIKYQESKARLLPYSISANLPVYDINGNQYQTVVRNGRVWMNENLRVTRYSNGDTIPDVTENEEWSRITIGASCSIDNNPGHNQELGRLYNRFAVDDIRNLCPSGWHVPSFEEWNQVFTSVGAEEDPGEWIRQNLQGKTFTSMTGYRNNTGIFKDHQEATYFWWPRSGKDETILGFSVSRKSPEITYISKLVGENAGMSVRCVKD